MVGGHRIAQAGQHAGPVNRPDRARLGGQIDQERRLLDVGARRRPSRTDRPPVTESAFHCSDWPERRCDSACGTSRAARTASTACVDLRLRRPDVLQDRPAGRRCPCPAARSSDRCRWCRPGRRPRPAAGWPGSSPCTSGLMRPSKLRLPLSTAAATRSPSVTALATGVGQRAAVADARRAAVADHVESRACRAACQARPCSR